MKTLNENSLLFLIIALICLAGAIYSLVQTNKEISHQKGLISYKYFNIKDFGGGRGDSAEDQKAIQSAINAAHNAGGGIVYFPNKTLKQ